MKKIEIIPLAIKKIHQRKISEVSVVETLQKPEQIVEGYGGRMVAHRKYEIHGKPKLLRVVFEVLEEKLVVVTAYLTTIKRYWKENE